MKEIEYLFNLYTASPKPIYVEKYFKTLFFIKLNWFMTICHRNYDE